MNVTIAIGLFRRTFWMAWAGRFGLRLEAYPGYSHIGWFIVGVWPVPLSGYLHL